MNHLFYYSTHRLEAPRERLPVSELKTLIAKHIQGFNPSYTLVIEECGDHPDKLLRDDEEVRIRDIPHFYDQPPANFGAAL